MGASNSNGIKWEVVYTYTSISFSWSLTRCQCLYYAAIYIIDKCSLSQWGRFLTFKVVENFPPAFAIPLPVEDFAPPVKCPFPSVNVFLLSCLIWTALFKSCYYTFSRCEGARLLRTRLLKFKADFDFLRNFSEKISTFYHILVVSLFVLRSSIAIL